MKKRNICKMVVKDYGTTDNLKNIGFIMPDGKTLDFGCGSDVHRNCSHSDVGMYIYNRDPKANQDKSPWILIREWQNECGGVRVGVSDLTLYLDVVQKPTSKQVEKMKDMVIQRKGVVLERMDTGDNSLCSVEGYDHSVNTVNDFLRSCFK